MLPTESRTPFADREDERAELEASEGGVAWILAYTSEPRSRGIAWSDVCPGFMMSETFMSFRETRKYEIEWLNLSLERVESPGSQRTAVILDLRGVTLP